MSVKRLNTDKPLGSKAKKIEPTVALQYEIICYHQINKHLKNVRYYKFL